MAILAVCQGCKTTTPYDHSDDWHIQTIGDNNGIDELTLCSKCWNSVEVLIKVLLNCETSIGAQVVRQRIQKINEYQEKCKRVPTYSYFQ